MRVADGGIASYAVVLRAYTLGHRRVEVYIGATSA